MLKSMEIGENKVYLTRKYLNVKGKTACLSYSLKEKIFSMKPKHKTRISRMREGAQGHKGELP